MFGTDPLIFAIGAGLLCVYLLGRWLMHRMWLAEAWSARVTLIDEYKGERYKTGAPHTDCHIEYVREDGQDGVWSFTVENNNAAHARLRRLRPGDRLVKRRGAGDLQPG